MKSAAVPADQGCGQGARAHVLVPAHDPLPHPPRPPHPPTPPPPPHTHTHRPPARPRCVTALCAGRVVSFPPCTRSRRPACLHGLAGYKGLPDPELPAAAPPGYKGSVDRVLLLGNAAAGLHKAPLPVCAQIKTQSKRGPCQRSGVGGRQPGTRRPDHRARRAPNATGRANRQGWPRGAPARRPRHRAHPGIARVSGWARSTVGRGRRCGARRPPRRGTQGRHQPRKPPR